MILPKQNEADLEDLPEEVREKLEFHFVEELGEVLKLAIRDGEPEGPVYAEGDTKDVDRPLSSDLEH